MYTLGAVTTVVNARSWIVITQVLARNIGHPLSRCGRVLFFSMQKEAKEFLEREWNAHYWTRNTTQSMEEYIDDDDNWERASRYAWEQVDASRVPALLGEEEGEEDDDDDDDEGDEGEDDDEDEEDSPASEGNDVAGKEGASAGKTNKKEKTDADVPKVRTACDGLLFYRRLGAHAIAPLAYTKVSTCRLV